MSKTWTNIFRIIMIIVILAAVGLVVKGYGDIVQNAWDAGFQACIEENNLYDRY